MAALTADMMASYGDTMYRQYYAGLGICTFIVVVTFLLRIYAQHKVQKLHTLDNIFSVIAAISTLILIGVTFYGTAGGGSIHTTRVLFYEDGTVRPDAIPRLESFYKSWWSCSWIWLTPYTFIKLSIVAFLWRIFSMRGKVFRRVVIGMGVYTIAYGITFTFEFLFQCVPIPYFWQRGRILAQDSFGIPISGPTPTGFCVAQTSHVAAPLLIGVISDVLLLCLPIVAVWNLQLDRRRKLSILFALSLGVFAIALDILRFVVNFKLQTSGDLTWNNMPGLFWNAVEFSVAYLCMCVPALAPLMRHGGDKKSKRHSPRYLATFSRRPRVNRNSSTTLHDSESLTELNDVHFNNSRDSALTDGVVGGNGENNVTVKSGPFHMPYGGKDGLSSICRDGGIEVTHTIEVSRSPC